MNFPISAVIIGCASSLLMDSRSPWIYGAAAMIATTSKALITYRGKHVFNPANLGVSVMLLLLPEQAASMPHLFAGHVMPSIIFFSLGLFTVLWAGQTEISLSWLLGFVFFAFIRAGILGVPWERTVTPILGPGLLLFTFHMISDPASTPRTRFWRISFGMTVALIDALLRYKEIPGSPLFALLIVGAMTPLIRDLENRSASKAPPERVDNSIRLAS
jgi:Na+-translocating ferredoxin:NAD+ oxidoreductase RnfD subunit